MIRDPKTMTILLVEDAATMRKIETKILLTLGFENIVEAVDGDDAIQILEQRQDIELIISDWNMPNKGGYDLLVWVRASVRYGQTPFIMATAQADREQANTARQAGVSGFIAKPFSADELGAQIADVLGMRKDVAKPAAPKARTGGSGRITLRAAHIQITDHIILGMLQEMIRSGEVSPRYFDLETQCLAGWNPVQDAIEKGDVDVAFMLAPIAMDLFHFGVPLKMVLLAHRCGSIFVRKAGPEFGPPYERFFQGRSILIPHKMSVHHMLTHMFFRQLGLKASLDKGSDVDINLEVVAPVNMPEFLKTSPEARGFIVAEPIGSKAVAAGIGERLFLSHQLWRNHPCCIVAVRDDFSGPYEDAVFEFTELLVKAGSVVQDDPQRAAAVGVDFLDPKGNLGLKAPVLHKVLTDPDGIKTGDLFPAHQDLDVMQRYMHDVMGVGSLVDVESFIDSRFAEIACVEMKTYPSAMLDTRENVMALLQRGQRGDVAAIPTMAAFTDIRVVLDRGQYLFFAS